VIFYSNKIWGIFWKFNSPGRSTKYRAINNYLDQKRLCILMGISKSRLSDVLDTRKYFGLHKLLLKLDQTGNSTVYHFPLFLGN
jgi:hypothetical protein